MQKAILRNYQEVSKAHIKNVERCGLFLDMGLGKTLTSLMAVSELIDDLDIRKILVIAPKKVCENVWNAEAVRWKQTKHLKFSFILGTRQKREAALKQDADVYIINRDNVVWLCALFGGSMLPFDMIIIDESSSFKNHASERFKALKKATENTYRMVLLTGTPAPNGLKNLWSQLFLLDRGERLEKTIGKFREKYCNAVVKGQFVDYSVPKSKEDHIIHQISDICLSMKSEGLIDLPEIVYNYIPVKLSKESRNMYDEFKKESILELYRDNESVELTAMTANVLSNKLLQMAGGAVYYDTLHNYTKVGEDKIDRLKEILEELDGKPVLIAFWFKHSAELILKSLKSYKPRILKTPEDFADWNAGKIPVAMAHPASAGHGLNLQFGGCNIVWFTTPWDLELYQQFNKRLHRSGQKETVYIHHLIGENTEDERVISAIQGKAEMQSYLIDTLNEEVKQILKDYEKN